MKSKSITPFNKNGERHGYWGVGKWYIIYENKRCETLIKIYM